MNCKHVTFINNFFYWIQWNGVCKYLILYYLLFFYVNVKILFKWITIIFIIFYSFLTMSYSDKLNLSELRTDCLIIMSSDQPNW